MLHVTDKKVRKVVRDGWNMDCVGFANRINLLNSSNKTEAFIFAQPFVYIQGVREILPD